jgi:voltage-gated sodium channel
MLGKVRALVGAGWFQAAIIVVIVINAVVIGLETDAGIMERHGALLLLINWLIQKMFVVEITLRLVAHWPRPQRFFRDGWNLFDFVVVAVSLVPAVGPFATVVRLGRILRLARLMSVSPGLRLIVTTMLRSIPSMGHVVLLLGLLVYLYGVTGVYLFRDADPGSWGTLRLALLSVFQLLTLEGWNELQASVIARHPWAWVYFASFIVIGVFVVVNLFIAVVLNNLESAKLEEAVEAVQAASAAGDIHDQALAEVVALRERLEVLERLLRASADSVKEPRRP